MRADAFYAVVFCILAGTSIVNCEDNNAEESACKKCDDVVGPLIESLRQILDGMEPIIQENVSTCHFINITNVKTLQTCDGTCSYACPGKEDCFIQRLSFSVTDLLMRFCFQDLLSGIPGLLKFMGVPIPGDMLKCLEHIPYLGKPVGKVLEFTGVGKRSPQESKNYKYEDNEKRNCNMFNILMKDCSFSVEMELDWANDSFSVQKVVHTCPAFESIQGWFEADSVLAAALAIVTNNMISASIIGHLLKLIFSLFLPGILRDESIIEQLKLLNCGN